MIQTFKLFCLTAFVLLLLQLTDVGKTERPDLYYSEQAPVLRNLDRLSNTKLVRMAKGAFTTVRGEVSKFGIEVKDQLNINYQKKREKDNDYNDIIPNAIKNNVLEPTKAVAQVSKKKAAKGIDNVVTKSPVLEIPVALGVATASVIKHQVSRLLSRNKSYYENEDIKAPRNQNNPRGRNLNKRNGA